MHSTPSATIAASADGRAGRQGERRPRCEQDGRDGERDRAEGERRDVAEQYPDQEGRAAYQRREQHEQCRRGIAADAEPEERGDAREPERQAEPAAPPRALVCVEPDGEESDEKGTAPTRIPASAEETCCSP